jgi:hypothetical protein
VCEKQWKKGSQSGVGEDEEEEENKKAIQTQKKS